MRNKYLVNRVFWRLLSLRSSGFVSHFIIFAWHLDQRQAKFFSFHLWLLFEKNCGKLPLFAAILKSETLGAPQAWKNQRSSCCSRTLLCKKKTGNKSWVSCPLSHCQKNSSILRDVNWNQGKVLPWQAILGDVNFFVLLGSETTIC